MNQESPERYQPGLPGILGTVDGILSRVEAVILSAGIILLALNTCMNVVARFGLGQGLFFSGEVNRILIVLITFAGIGYAARHGRHIRMSALYDALPLFGRKFLMVLIAFVTSAVMIFLCYFSVRYVAGVYEKGRVLPALGLPVWLMYVWVPVGFGVTAIQYFLTGVKNLVTREVYLSTAVADDCGETGT